MEHGLPPSHHGKNHLTGRLWNMPYRTLLLRGVNVNLRRASYSLAQQDRRYHHIFSTQ